MLAHPQLGRGGLLMPPLELELELGALSFGVPNRLGLRFARPERRRQAGTRIPTLLLALVRATIKIEG
jgi:hypothetical protein